MPVQLGGGIRDMTHDRGWLGNGVDRVIIGTAAVRDPAFVKHGVRATIPAASRSGSMRATARSRSRAGRRRRSVTALEIARRFEDAGVAAIIYTDIARDGLLQGLNLDATIELAEAVTTPVIASGGLASIEDVKQLLAPRARKLAGAIAGRALYDGRLDPAEALKLIRDARAASR